MVHGIVIPADGESPLRRIDTTQPDAIGTAVGGFMEAVDIVDLGITVYVNESGLLQHLPFNSRVSFLWWHHVPAARRRAMLVGDAVVVGLPDEDGADTEVPDATRKLLFTDADYIVEVRPIGQQQWQVGLPVRLEFWDALMWAALLLEQIPGAADSRVVPVEPHESAATAA
ncbi:hypothetical protein RL72_01596 [Microbacterium azadirachtae]|uniref:DUF3846 domain-containing protein n=1 Tax=Microbacterium azadirachtae TaxID=582680 RepID=A0A0F0KVH2_9MICO|nr:DUF3846 domain-containing protein [Microbacterium azadirachtae]KJL24873.1 hypothetical protein RL72_01596 [Microbacterium azadirachtae]